MLPLFYTSPKRLLPFPEMRNFLTNRNIHDKNISKNQKKFYGQTSETNLGALDPGKSGSGVFFYEETMKPGQKAILALEDGSIFEGRSFGFPGEKTGEVVFNTSMTGYQEILTDPSYKGQIVIMTYPLIGNYGVNKEDIESQNPKVEGFVVKENSTLFSNWRGETRLSDYLIHHQIMGVEGVDTRALTKHIRSVGAMKAILSTEDLDRDRLVEKAKSIPRSDRPGLGQRSHLRETVPMDGRE